MCGWVVGISSAGWAPPVLWARSIGPLRVYDPGLAVIRAKRSERREKRFSQFTPSSYPSDTAAAADGVKPSLPAPFRACTRSASHGARHLQVQRSPAATSSRSPFLPSSSPVPPVRVPRRPPATFRCNYYYGDGGGFRKNYDHIPKQFREENLKDGRYIVPYTFPSATIRCCPCCLCLIDVYALGDASLISHLIGKLLA
ncbi:uncharacterized protein LOC101784725 isoform X3 [Setaria italica]|uniref:uncharacterized protein LOC101784725 isoform X3 n=1 Tax=Setaria italica TaxID=4555 RepID=UPI000BE5DECC|nr:uncharacterized protein LOC101784725 isoform X3 [Setaria italica]